MPTPSYIVPGTRFDNEGQAAGYMDWLRNNSQQVSPFGSAVDPNNPMGSLASDYKSQMDLANKRNEDRYQEILKGYRDRRIRALDTAQGLGAQEAKDIGARFTNLRGNTQQDLVSRGLTGTTVLPSMMSGIARQESDAQGALNERLRREQIGLDTGLDQDTLQFMERKNEVGPDFNLLARLSQQAGAWAGGGGLQMMGGGTGRSQKGKESTDAGDFWREAPQAPEPQGRGENDQAYKQRVSNFYKWQQAQENKKAMKEGRDPRNLMPDMSGLQGNDARRQGEDARALELNAPRGPMEGDFRMGPDLGNFNPFGSGMLNLGAGAPLSGRRPTLPSFQVDQPSFGPPAQQRDPRHYNAGY